MTPTWLCTREDLIGALDVKLTARNVAQLDRSIEAGSRSVEKRLHRTFRPLVATRYFRWPDINQGTPWRLWLDEHEVISITLFVAGGVTIVAADYFLEPVNSGPPYRWVEVDRSSLAAFAFGVTSQQAIAITGLFGYSNDELGAGLLAEALDGSEVEVNVSDSGLVGVGDILRVDSERLQVLDKAPLDTGQNSSALTAAVNAQTITGITAGTIKVGEVLLVDAERMLVTDVAGTTVTVKRAWHGTVLASHALNADIYAYRTLTVERGALGTTAATHTDASVLWKHRVPGLVRELALAEAINIVQQEGSGYARRSGVGEARGSGKPSSDVEASGRGLDDLREQAEGAFGRRARNRAI